MGYVEVQILDKSGNWRTVAMVANNSLRISQGVGCPTENKQGQPGQGC